jgi:adenosylhomocysteine nucleosidase
VTDGAAVRRVGLLAPMEHELRPLVRRLGLEGGGSRYEGRLGDLEVVAMLTNIGMDAAASATERILDERVDWVVLVGIAGGVDPDIKIGDLVVPEMVIDRANGTEHAPSELGDVSARGVLSCGDDLVLEPEALAAMVAAGVVALDMETAAVAAVCETARRPWSVFRSISDHTGEGLVDDSLFAMTRPDGTADTDGLARYLAENPEQAEVLARLARDMTVATEAAAELAIRSVAALT